MKFTIKNIALNALLLAVSIGISLLILEQGFRCWLFGWQAFDIPAMRNNVPISNTPFMVQSPYDDIYWALKPNLNTSFKLAHLTTNSYGLADQEYLLKKPANTYRIAVLGDSYSMPSGVDTDKSFHALLESRMNNASHTNQLHYEFVNFSVGGFGLERYNATLEHLVPPWQPDAILLGYCAFNDQQPLPPKTGKVPPFHPYIANGFTTSYVYDYWDAYNKGRRLFQSFSNITLDQKHLDFVERELANMRRLADAIKPNIPILFAYLDNREHADTDIKNLNAIAQKYNMVFVDTTQSFRNTKIDDYSISLLDSHPNTKAHAMFADTLYAAIAQQHIFEFHTENIAR
jgi:hypothetical protein